MQDAESLNDSITNLERKISETEKFLLNTDTMDGDSFTSKL